MFAEHKTKTIMENFNSIYSENHKMVLNFINMKVNEFSVAEELTNDVFMRVHKHLNNYDSDKASVKTWVMNIAKNIVIDHYRKSKLETISVDKEDENGVSGYATWKMFSASSKATPHSEMVRGEIGDEIQRSISSLDGKYRDVADLFFNKELSYEEISKELNIPIGTVKGQISRARKILVTDLETLKV